MKMRTRLAAALLLTVLAGAATLSARDPAVKAGRFVYEIAPWWGPKSLRY